MKITGPSCRFMQVPVSNEASTGFITLKVIRYKDSTLRVIIFGKPPVEALVKIPGINIMVSGAALKYLKLATQDFTLTELARSLSISESQASRLREALKDE